jgi:hypothetical protein
LETSFDLNFTKTIAFSHYNLLIGLRVMNLLNNKWLTPPGDFSSDDLSQWVEQGVTIADSGTDPMRPSHIAAPFKAFRNMPRQIFFTLGFGF